MDHSVKVLNIPRRKSSQFLHQCSKIIVNRRRFENDELESLYQRYIFKLNQSSIFSVLILMILITLSLIVIELLSLSRWSPLIWSTTTSTSDAKSGWSTPQVASGFVSLTLVGVYHVLQLIILISLFIIIATSRAIRSGDAHILPLCYVILFLSAMFCVMNAPIDWPFVETATASDISDDAESSASASLSSPSWLESQVGIRPRWWSKGGQNASEGVWQIVFVTLLMYTMMPIQTRLAIIMGVLLSVCHTLAAIFMAREFLHLNIHQIMANCAIFIWVNCVGLFVHNLMETAGRKAFLDTRNCINARLEMEDENEKLERLLLSVLPQHVAMEMKADILSPRELGQFHKIYIQKHENVR